jgi:hypothetical protein
VSDATSVTREDSDGYRPAPDRVPPLPWWAVALLAAFALVAFVALGWHATASWQIFLSRDASRPIDARVAAGAAARSMEPWNPTARAAYGYARSQQLYARGRLTQAVDVMAAAYRDDVNDTEMLAYFKRIQAALTLATNRKAHLQHGHEGPGGTLRPSDIER